jgi:hypothetical protein
VGDVFSLQIDRRFFQIDARFDQIDAQFERIDGRFKQVDAKLAEILARLPQPPRRGDGASDANAAQDGQFLPGELPRQQRHRAADRRLRLRELQ